jgi:integrase
VVDVAPHGLSRHQEKRGGFGTKAEAVVAMTRMLLDRQNGTYVPPNKLTSAEYLRVWLAAVGDEGAIRRTTLKTYEIAVRIHLVPRIGEVPLQQLTRRTIKEMYEAIRHGGRARGLGDLSSKTVHNVHLALHRALEDAVDDGLLRTNPSDRAHRVGPDLHEIVSWSPAEVRQFLCAIHEEPNRVLWRLAVCTGMRRGELLGLKWSDVDLEAGCLSVRRQLLREGRRLRFGPPKTRSSRRSICLDAGSVAALVAHRTTRTLSATSSSAS